MVKINKTLKKIKSLERKVRVNPPQFYVKGLTSTLSRVEFKYIGDFGLQLKLNKDINNHTFGIGSEVVVLEGSLEGRILEVVEVIDSRTLRLDDVPTHNSVETITIRFN